MIMMLRLTGAVVFFLGTVIAILAAWGWLSAPSMMSGSFVAAEAMDARQWSASWRLSSVMLILVGLATAFSGIAVSMSRVWGFLLLSAAATATAAFPWVLQVAGGLRYAFEVPRVSETVVCVVVAICSVAAYFRFRGRQLSRNS